MNPRKDLLSLNVGKLLGYGLGLVVIAETYLSSLASTASRAARFRTMLADLQDDHNAWSADVCEQGAAVTARDNAFEKGRALYRQVIGSAEAAVAEGNGGDGLPSLLAACPVPSSLRFETAFLAFETLARGMEANAAAFASVDLTLEDAARLRAHGQALQDALNRRVRFTQDRGVSSGQRKGSRAALIVQIRAMEKLLRLRLTDEEGIEAFNSHRADFLPRYTQKPRPRSSKPAG